MIYFKDCLSEINTEAKIISIDKTVDLTEAKKSQEEGEEEELQTPKTTNNCKIFQCKIPAQTHYEVVYNYYAPPKLPTTTTATTTTTTATQFVYNQQQQHANYFYNQQVPHATLINSYSSRSSSTASSPVGYCYYSPIISKLENNHSQNFINNTNNATLMYTRVLTAPPIFYQNRINYLPKPNNSNNFNYTYFNQPQFVDDSTLKS
jgi:hypothetical protein